MVSDELDKTMAYKFRGEEGVSPQDTLLIVYTALKEKGYNPISQLVGYLLSGDPAYITNHRNARNLIRKYERDELLEELITSYLEKNR
ncbi:MAG TPA: IreB family regulatory phosphoprotein [Syntrophomonadaceae bacterium]|nr:IreB family regulatory phosphoprotein [Syntrophomonadaceae bacterium]